MPTIAWAILLLVPAIFVGLTLLLGRSEAGRKRTALQVGREPVDEASSAIIDVVGPRIARLRQADERGPARENNIQRIGPRWLPAGKPDR